MDINTKASFSDAVTQREKDNRRLAYSAAIEGITLLENDGAMPVPLGNIALFGAGAAHTIKGGTGSGEVNERHSVGILEGLEKAGYRVTTQKWLADYDEAFQQAERDHAKLVAKRLRRLDFISVINPLPFRYPFGRKITPQDVAESDTDTCLYVIARQSGECYDRDPAKNDYALSEVERENLKTLAAAYEKTILVINTGASMDLAVLDETKGVNAVVFFCQQGCEGGAAFADILSGAATPSGRLSASWAQRYEDIPFGDEYGVVSGRCDEADYKEGLYVGYRYFDSFGVAPRYPFGYGLGYTEFALGEPEVTADKTAVRVRLPVTNTGETYSGKETVQLYASCPAGGLGREYQSLAAFAKTRLLAPGETQTLTLAFDMRDLAAYDEKTARFVLEAGDYVLRLGRHSRDTRPAALLRLAAGVTVSRHQNICPPAPGLKTLEQPGATEAPPPENAKIIPLDPAAFEARTVDYTPPGVSGAPEVRRILATLEARDMVELVVGAGMFGPRPFLNVPGSGGNTTSVLVSKGLSNIVLCDGPAGLRLQKTSAVTKKGAVKMVETQLAAMKNLPKIAKKLLFGNPQKDKLVYQFATAFPVGNALAQTWNTQLLQAVGSAVGREMEEYGVSVWLAPGMNIQRNPLCGRNYEYFSEDPLLSGKLAAAITRGVQSHEGCFVTLKHFACNNQEERRQWSSSNLDERTLREIYLRGFEIALREGRPGCVMSSYNKINGVYAPNSYDLCTKVLRNEWGFDGLVMSDWFSTWARMKLASSALALASGNDLIMPGGKSSKKVILAGLKNGLLRQEDLKRCSANVIKLILASRTQKEFEQTEGATHGI